MCESEKGLVDSQEKKTTTKGAQHTRQSKTTHTQREHSMGDQKRVWCGRQERGGKDKKRQAQRSTRSRRLILNTQAESGRQMLSVGREGDNTKQQDKRHT